MVDQTAFATARSAIDSAGASIAPVPVVLPVYDIHSLPPPIVVSLPLTPSIFSHLCSYHQPRLSVSHQSFHAARPRCLLLGLSHRQHGALVYRHPAIVQEVPATKDNIRSITLGKENKEVIFVPANSIMVHPPRQRDRSAAFKSVAVGIGKLWCCKRWRKISHSPQSAYKPVCCPIPNIA